MKYVSTNVSGIKLKKILERVKDFENYRVSIEEIGRPIVDINLRELLDKNPMSSKEIASILGKNFELIYRNNKKPFEERGITSIKERNRRMYCIKGQEKLASKKIERITRGTTYRRSRSQIYSSRRKRTGKEEIPEIHTFKILDHFSPDAELTTKEVAKKSGYTEMYARIVLNQMVNVGLLKKTEGKEQGKPHRFSLNTRSLFKIIANGFYEEKCKEIGLED